MSDSGLDYAVWRTIPGICTLGVERQKCMTLKGKPREASTQDGPQGQQAAVNTGRQPLPISSGEAEMYRTIIQTANEGIWLVDLEARTLFVNDRMAELLGYSAGEMQGRAVLEFVFPEDLPVAQQRVASTLQGHFAQFDFRFRRCDGNELPALAATSPVRDSAGQITGALGMFTDLTESKRLEQHTGKALEALLQMARTLAQPTLEARQANDERVSNLLRRLGELACTVLECKRLAIHLVDSATDFLSLGPAIGMSPQEEQIRQDHYQGRRLSEIFAAEVVKRLAAGELVLASPASDIRPVQEPLPMKQYLHVPLLSGRRLVGIMGYDYGLEEHTYTREEMALAQAVGNLLALMIDREHLTRSSRQARQQVETLEQEKNERETFISLAVHELRTPLTIISAHAQMLERAVSMDPARQAETIRKIREQTARLRRLIDDLQDVSRIAAGTFELSPELTNLNALAKSVVEEQQTTTQRHTLRLDLPPAPIAGMWDRQRLSQVFSNLLSNAIKYAEGGEIRVTLQRGAEEVQVAVQDQGTGMTADEIGQLFQLYSRLARTRQIAGNGLGLDLTRGILAAHGGRIWASSPGLGQGCTFTFTLPLSATL
jgi:PAS domain S-box-containing protein